MVNLLLLPALMIGTYFTVRAVQRFSKNTADDRQLAGRIALAALLIFTGAAHFFKTAEMAQMVPAFIPNRELIVIVTGVLELAAAVGLLPRKTAPVVGKLLVLFFVAIFPANIYAAINHVDLGGHGEGMRYLILRLPLQLFFIAWTWWFTFRRHCN
jgi:uncharacterized membrane protein